MSPEKSARSSRRYQHVLPPPRVFIGLQADRDVFSALMPAWYVRSHHLHPSHPAGEASFNWRSKRVCPPAGRILVDKRRLHLDWLPRSRSSAAGYTRRCAFCFGRASMRPLVRTCVHHPCITCCTLYTHTRAHTRALLPIRSRFLRAVDPYCFPHTSQVISLQDVGARASCRRLSIPTAPTAHAGAVRFFRIVRSAVRFCHGAFWEQ